MEPNNTKKIWIGVIIVLLVVGGVFMYMRARSGGEKVPDNGSLSNSLTISDQNPNTIAVIVDSASCDKNCFVAVYESAGGTTGALIASSKLLGPRAHRNVSIVMTTRPGANYHALLHGDDGNGIFSATLDMPLKNETGVIAADTFMVRETALIDGELDVKG